MGVSTIFILTKGTRVESIASALRSREKYTDIDVIINELDYTSMRVFFKDGEAERRMHVSYANYCEQENGIAGILCSLGHNDNAIEIAKFLCNDFGGYLDENDCDDEGFYPIKFDLYERGVNFTNLDLFKNKVMSQFGYKNLKPAMALLNEFREVKDDIDMVLMACTAQGQCAIFVGTFQECFNVANSDVIEYSCAIFEFKKGFLKYDIEDAIWKNFQKIINLTGLAHVHLITW
jgi:hypothetical protein